MPNVTINFLDDVKPADYVTASSLKTFKSINKAFDSLQRDLLRLRAFYKTYHPNGVDSIDDDFVSLINGVYDDHREYGELVDKLSKIE